MGTKFVSFLSTFLVGSMCYVCSRIEQQGPGKTHTQRSNANDADCSSARRSRCTVTRQYRPKAYNLSTTLRRDISMWIYVSRSSPAHTTPSTLHTTFFLNAALYMSIVVLGENCGHAQLSKYSHAQFCNTRLL